MAALEDKLDMPIEASYDALSSGLAKLEKDNVKLIKDVMDRCARLKEEDGVMMRKALGDDHEVEQKEEADRIAVEKKLYGDKRTKAQKKTGKTKKGGKKRSAKRLVMLLRIRDVVVGALGEALADKATMTMDGACSHIAVETCLRVVRRIDEHIGRRSKHERRRSHV
jgi:hypothetical protein